MHIDCALSGAATDWPATTSQDISDRDLIHSIAKGDKRAMRVLFVRHNVRTFRFVIHLVRDVSVAEDVVSEVFLDVWRQADKFEGRSQVPTWLLAIARHKALRAVRRRPTEDLEDGAVELLEDPADDPELAI